jgi:cytidyltransferase-like protein
MSAKNKIRVAVSGYFDPIHIGHLEYLRMAKELGDSLVVIVNNNHQCKLKKGKHFMDENDRVEIVKALRFVDEVFLSVDNDRTVCKSLEEIKPDIFANGGDRATSEVPETPVCKKFNIKMVDGLGDKIRSSSSLTGLSEIS